MASQTLPMGLTGRSCGRICTRCTKRSSGSRNGRFSSRRTRGSCSSTPGTARRWPRSATALTSSPGITLLLGEAGTGKTTLLRAALHAERRAEHRYVVLNNPTLSRADFYEILADRFGLPDASGSKAQFLLDFERDLLERHRAAASPPSSSTRRRASPTSSSRRSACSPTSRPTPRSSSTSILVGQRELADRLNDPSLRQLKQRIGLRCSLAPLDLDSTASYIATRLQVAGAVPVTCSRRTPSSPLRGLPRNPEDHRGHLRERAARGLRGCSGSPIDRPIVIDVCRGLDLPVNGRRPHGLRRTGPRHRRAR